MYYGVQNIDKQIIEKYLNYTNGFFIEVGGNDGITQSNTAYLEFNLQWNGLLIESIPTKYNQMVMNRPNSICVNTCLSNEDDLVVEFNDVNLMSFVKGSRKTQENEQIWINDGESCQGIKSLKYEVKTKKLQTILNQYNITNIDFFSLDVEGYELTVLQGLNFDLIRPKFILIECTHKEEIFQFMEQIGYDVIDKFVIHDYLFLDRKNR